MKLLLIVLLLKCWPFLMGMGALLLVTLYYQRKTIRAANVEKGRLLEKIEALKKQLATQAIATAEKQEVVGLNKARIEATINTKLGASAWEILNLVYKKPSISNREIAEEVSLSVEGVSSSLRRMYTSFGVKAANNKRIALIMRAVRLSKAALAEDDNELE